MSSMAFQKVIIRHERAICFICHCAQNLVFFSFENVKICIRKDWTDAFHGYIYAIYIYNNSFVLYLQRFPLQQEKIT